MDAIARCRAELIEANLNEYGYHYDALTFPTPERTAAVQAERRELLTALAGLAETGCNGTKLDCRRLAPGCRKCIEGRWSCLFVNGRCNGRCFYCPAPQDELGWPATNGLTFPEPDEYVAYLERFGFTGASISGGEPLLTLQKTLRFIAAVKERFGAGVHLWLYTNGTLVERENLRQLRAAGLDEIRFDIGATRYRLKKAALAAGIIEHVTVEIPAVPEDEPLLAKLLPELRTAGVHYLNLHQLRLTPYNYPHLAGRGYTFLHGEKVTVLESELTALRLLRLALERGIDLPVNYCSFVYKHRFQRAAARRRAAALVCRPWEAVTANGYLRALLLTGSAEAVRRQAAALAEVPAELWRQEGEKLAVAASLWPQIDCRDGRLQVSYSEAAVLPAASGRHPFSEIPLARGRKVVVERRPVAEVDLPAAERYTLHRWLRGETGTAPPALVARFEEVPGGLQDYF